jgi:hypothetical protein
VCGRKSSHRAARGVVSAEFRRIGGLTTVESHRDIARRRLAAPSNPGPRREFAPPCQRRRRKISSVGNEKRLHPARLHSKLTSARPAAAESRPVSDELGASIDPLRVTNRIGSCHRGRPGRQRGGATSRRLRPGRASWNSRVGANRTLAGSSPPPFARAGAEISCEANPVGSSAATESTGGGAGASASPTSQGPALRRSEGPRAPWGRRRRSRLAPGHQAQAARWRFNRRGVVTVRSHAYIRPSLGNAIAIGKRGAARLLLSSARFVSFRAPIDSVMDPGGQPRRPMDPFLSLRGGFGPSRG